MKFNNETIRTAVKEWCNESSGGGFVNSQIVKPIKTEKKYGHISKWNVSEVTDMSNLFRHGYGEFNEDIGNWDVSNATDMQGMFESAEHFNQDLSNWDVSSVINMKAMFYYAESFNQDIGAWDVSNVTNMSKMFAETKLFNQNLGNWEVSNVTDMSFMFNGINNFEREEYIEDENEIILSFNIEMWKVNNVTDMSFMFSNTSGVNPDIGNWDVSNVTTMYQMLYYSSFNQDISNWDVSNVNRMSGMFQACPFNHDISDWDVSNVTDMQKMFYQAHYFNQDLSKWDISNVTDMKDMFIDADAYSYGDLKIKDKKDESEIWIAMEKSTFYFGDDEEFEALELGIEFSNDVDGEHEIIDEIKEKLNCEHLIFTETENKDGEFELQRIIDLPAIDDYDGYGDGGHHGPFSSNEELINYVKGLETISFKDIDS
jgi:surface protein